MQGALALQIILLEMYHGEEDAFLAVQHNLHKLSCPNKIGELTSQHFSWKITTQELSFKINTLFYLRFINHFNKKKELFLPEEGSLWILIRHETQKFSYE